MMAMVQWPHTQSDLGLQQPLVITQQQYAQQQIMAQQGLFGFGSVLSTATTNGTSGDDYDFNGASVKPMFPPVAAVPALSDNLAWLDRRVNELRVAL